MVVTFSLIFFYDASKIEIFERERGDSDMKICCEVEREVAEAFERALDINRESVEDVMRSAVLEYIRKTKLTEKCQVLSER